MSTFRQGHHGHGVFEGQPLNDSTARPAWFTESMDFIPDTGRRLLENYNKIPQSEVLEYVITTVSGRSIIFVIRLTSLKWYSSEMKPSTSGHTHALAKSASWISCCQSFHIGSMFYLVSARERLSWTLVDALAKRSASWCLRSDKQQLQGVIVSGDVFADVNTPEGRNLTSLEGKMDIVHAASLLHSRGWDDMVKAAKRLVSLTLKKPGSPIIGNQIGILDAGQYPMPTGKGYNYRNNPQSMERFWQQVGVEARSKWKAESGMFLPPAVQGNLQHAWAKSDPNMRMIWLCVMRIE